MHRLKLRCFLSLESTQSSGRKNRKQEKKIIMSKVGKLKMNPVGGSPNQLDCDKSFYFHCPGGPPDSEHFSSLPYWDPKTLLRRIPKSVGLVSGLVFSSPGHHDLLLISQWLSQTYVPALWIDASHFNGRVVSQGFYPLPLLSSSLSFPKHLPFPTKSPGPSSHVRGSLSQRFTLHMSLRMGIHWERLAKKVSSNVPCR